MINPTFHIAPSQVAVTELLMSFLFGFVLSAGLWIPLTVKIISKRFPLKLRKVNQLKRNYRRNLARLEHREGIIRFIYQLASVFVDQLAHKIKEVEEEKEKAE